MFKKQIVIFITLLTIFLVVSGCQKQSKNNQTVINNQEQQESGKDSQNQEIETELEKEWQGELIHEKDGWKRYRNEYYGVEFRFRDKSDEIVIYDHIRNGIGLSSVNSKKEDIRSLGINFFKYIGRDDIEAYSDLKHYLEINYDYLQHQAEFIGINQIKNNNDLIFYELVTSLESTYNTEIKGVLDGERNFVRINNHNLDNVKESIINSFKFIN